MTADHSVRMIVIAGQSNAVSAVNTTDISDPSLAEDYLCVQFLNRTSNSSAEPDWATFGPTDLQPRTGQRFGVELSLGRVLNAKYGCSRTVIVKFACNGTSLRGNWMPDDVPLSGDADNLYTQLVDIILEQEESMGARLAGIAWIQGNGDAGVLSKANAYASNMRTFVGSLRTDLPARDFRFVYDQLPAGVVQTYTDAVRAQQSDLAKDPGFTMVKTDSLKLRDDDHYDKQSYIDLGYMFGRCL